MPGQPGPEQQAPGAPGADPNAAPGGDPNAEGGENLPGEEGAPGEPEVDEFGNPIEDAGDSVPMTTKPRQEPAGSRPPDMSEMDPMETAMMANPMLQALDPVMGEDPMMAGQGGPGGPPVEAEAPGEEPDSNPAEPSDPRAQKQSAKAVNADTHDFTGFQGSCKKCGMDKPEDGDDWVPKCDTVNDSFDFEGAKQTGPLPGVDLLDDDNGKDNVSHAHHDEGGASQKDSPSTKAATILRMISYIQEANPQIGDDTAYDLALDALANFDPLSYGPSARPVDGPLTDFVKKKLHPMEPKNVQHFQDKVLPKIQDKFKPGPTPFDNAPRVNLLPEDVEGTAS